MSAPPAPPPDAVNGDPAPPAAAGRVRRLLPWAVAAAVLTWLFSTIPLDALRAALERAPMALVVGFVVVYSVLVLVGDALALWATFRWSLPDARLRYRDVLDIRGASYLLAVLHYSAGQGGIALFVARRAAVPIARAAGAVMLILGVNAIAIALASLVGLSLGGAPENPTLRLVVIALAVGFPVYLAVIAWRPAFLARWKLLAPLFDAGLKGHLVAVGARLPHLAWLLVGQFIAMRLFGIDPPFGQALTLLPLVFVVSVLPISPSGLGTTQATAVALFARYAPGDAAEQRATVLACFLAMQLLALVVQAVIGVVFLRRLTRAGIIDRSSP
jgi:hypothetical protein